MPTSTFEEYVRGIVDDFLQTVVVVDDEALPPSGPTEGTSDESVDPQVAPGGTDIVTLKEPSGANRDGHELPAKEVIDAFALKGLVCSILDPDSSVEERLANIADRADLLVMDWWIDGDRGGRAIELIEAILKRDQDRENRRLRVVAIYTGQAELEPVADALAEMLKKFYDDLPCDRSPGSLSMTKGPVRMTVLAKEHVRTPSSGQQFEKVKVADLPDRLAVEFAQLAQGLVSGVALQGLAALRWDTHRLLERVGPRMDRGYLGHRVAQMRPSDAEGHLTTLVSAEIGSVLADAEIGSQAGMDAIGLWLKWATGNGLKPGALFSFSPHLTNLQIKRMLKLGLGDESTFAAQRKGIRGRKDKQLKQVRDSATKLFCADETEALNSTGAFAAGMILRTTYRKPRRELRLGTVVFRNKKFALCLQPVCDSVRLSDQVDTSFPFLPLEPVHFDTPNLETDLVVLHPLRQEWVRLKLVRKPASIEMLEFRANGSGVVQAYKEVSRYGFRSTVGRYRWVADLKPEFAQRFANELGQQFSRVGLDEPELLRLTRRS
jgi:hypothetical protein